MENPLHSSSKPRPIEIPVANMLSPESEICENTSIYTASTANSCFESALPRINSELRLPDQEVRSKSVFFSEVGKGTRNTEDGGLELPDVRESKYLVAFSDLQQAERINPKEDSGFPERPFRVSTLLQDRIRVLENEKKDNGINSRLTGKRLRKPNRSESSTSELSTGEIMLERSAEGQTYQTHRDQKEKEEELEGQLSLEANYNEKQVVSMLGITEQTTGEKDGKLSDGKSVNHAVKEFGIPSKSILKVRKNDASKPDNLTKTVNKTIKQLYKLNKEKEAESLSDLLESKLMTEKELSKAVKREFQEERDEKKRQEAKSMEKNRREAFFFRMEELERMEEEMRETRTRERETRRADAQKRREKNITLWNEKQTSILSTKISRAFKFSYFPLLIPDSRSSSSDEQSSSEDSGSSSDTSASVSARVSRQSSACSCASSTNKRKNRGICSSHSRQNRNTQKKVNTKLLTYVIQEKSSFAKSKLLEGLRKALPKNLPLIGTHKARGTKYDKS
ncbi:hypothetical protein OS493_017804 [Desmophyllum pertusum]|uniref:Uncharacterized protein n=1 Tax=Desmophyllum pertusum TaxID=174260 RepID=A0A9W9ZCP3_9CNID|nr:hypothetical protein OS493_017804 [Desmophyllum pertusum]